MKIRIVNIKNICITHTEDVSRLSLCEQSKRPGTGVELIGTEVDVFVGLVDRGDGC